MLPVVALCAKATLWQMTPSRRGEHSRYNLRAFYRIIFSTFIFVVRMPRINNHLTQLRADHLAYELADDGEAAIAISEGTA